MPDPDRSDLPGRPRRLFLSALVPAIAILLSSLLELLLSHLLGSPPSGLGLLAELLAPPIVILLSLVVTYRIVARGSGPFIELTAALRAVARDPSLGPERIPLVGPDETVELARAIRSLIVSLGAARADQAGLFRAIDHGPVGLLQVQKVTGVISYVNPAFCRLAAWPPPVRCLGRLAPEIDPAAFAAISEEERAQLDRGETRSVRRDIDHPAGTRSIAFTTVATTGGTPDGTSFLVFAEDLTPAVERDAVLSRHADAEIILPRLAASVTAARGLLELALRDPLLPGALRADLGAISDGTAEAARLLDPLRGRAIA
jgi:PAS domain-containing protein